MEFGGICVSYFVYNKVYTLREIIPLHFLGIIVILIVFIF